MATAIGTNTVTAIARRFILPTITDNIYRSITILYRLMKMNRRSIQGGTQIEVPLLYQRFSTGGMYRGFSRFNTTPSDTIKNAVFDWKQAQVTWSVDGLTLIKVDSPESIANFLTLQSTQATMELAEVLATSLFAPNVTNPDDLDSIPNMVGTGTTVGNPTYGGITRTANTWWNSYVQGAAGANTMTMAALQTWFTGGLVGGQQYTVIFSGQDQFNRFLALNTGTNGYAVQYVREPAGHDALLASPGFTNLLFNNVPWVVDSHVPTSQAVIGSAVTDTCIYGLNENVIDWVVSPRADFFLKPFSEPVDQDAMVASLLWAGNLINQSCRLHGLYINVNA